MFSQPFSRGALCKRTSGIGISLAALVLAACSTEPPSNTMAPKTVPVPEHHNSGSASPFSALNAALPVSQSSGKSKSVKDADEAFEKATGAAVAAVKSALEASERVERGRAELITGEYRLAVRDLTAAISSDLTNAEAYELRGIGYHHLENYAAAIADYDRAAAFSPSDPEIFSARGKAKAAMGDLDGGLADLSNAVRLAPSESRYLADRGAIELMLHDSNAALADYNRAIALNPKKPHYWTGRATVYADRSEPDAVIADCDRALTLDDDADAYLLRARAREQKNEASAALADLDMAVRLRPQDCVPYVARSYVYRMAGQLADALVDINRAIALAADRAESYGDRAFVYALEGKYEPARADADEMVTLAPNQADSYVTRARINAQYGHFDAVEPDAKHALTLDAKNGTAWALLASAQTERKDWKDAVESADHALEFGPKEQDAINSVHFARATALLQLGRPADAIPDLDRLITVNPTRLAFSTRATARMLLKQYTEALPDLNAAIAAQPDAQDYGNRAVVLWHLHRFDESLNDIDHAVTLVGDPLRARAQAEGVVRRIQAEYVADLKNASPKSDNDPVFPDLDRAIHALRAHGFKPATLLSEYASLKYKEQNWTAAMAAYDVYVLVEANDPAGYCGRGLCKSRLGDVVGALADYERAMALKPNFWRVTLLHAEAEAELGKWQQAADEYRRGLRTVTQLEQYDFLFGSAIMHCARIPDPDTELRNVLPKWTDGWPKTVGRFLAGEIQEQELFATADKAAADKRNSEYCEAYFYAGANRIANGDAATAKDYFSKCLATNERTFGEYKLAKAELNSL